jgi:hypothetical protein
VCWRHYLEREILCDWIRGEYCRWVRKWAVKFYCVNWRL